MSTINFSGKSNFFFTVKSDSPDINDKFLNNISDFGIHFFFGVSKHYDSDINCLNDIKSDFSKIENFDYSEMKFNSNYFSHLPNELIFSQDVFTIDEEDDKIEQQYTLSKIDLSNEDDKSFEIKVFKDPSKIPQEESETTFEEFFDSIVSANPLAQIH